MRRISVLLAAAGLMLLAAGCGDDGSSSSTTAPPTTQAVATTASAATLEAMLLDASDVGEGWRVSNPINADDLAAFGQVPCEDVALNPTIAERLTADTGIQFEPTDGSYKHLIELVLTADPDQLAEDLQSLHDATLSCSSVSTSGTLAVRELALPELGDQRYGLALTGTESADTTNTWYVRSAVVREGSVAIGIGVTEILPDPAAAPTITDDEMVQLVEAAVARMEAATGG
jgi:hypothetical protein